jgi:predicted PurR-regulated permease PerM
VLGLIGAIVVANVDNVVRPVVYRRVSRVHPMITLVGAFAGIRYFGPLGVLFGPLGLAYFFEVLALYRREYGSLADGNGARAAALGEEAEALTVATATPSSS